VLLYQAPSISTAFSDLSVAVIRFIRASKPLNLSALFQAIFGLKFCPENCSADVVPKKLQ
jgi:hypothetical protein